MATEIIATAMKHALPDKAAADQGFGLVFRKWLMGFGLTEVKIEHSASIETLNTARELVEGATGQNVALVAGVFVATVAACLAAGFAV
ncbi:hypothetical protein C8A00DRAFT_31209 [Chaetomidium leptoderma]|uniref:Uncharacterized protein n=1 Tax=Chaetomidium leptoderma TaxID=669021 RepID=A0AAN6VRF7_9PEZI|nr:hypothetical protein C8A00DRAFT_31209 [Chaetomidium leptoderma]